MAEKNAKNFRNELAKYGVFYTPKIISEKMKTYIPFKVEEVYDPTVGSGELLTVFDDDVKKYGQELFPEELDKAKEKLKNFEGYAGDTLTDDKFKDKQFQVVFSNPPYSVAWEPFMDERFEECGVLAPKSKADFAFLLHGIHHLKDDGIGLFLMFPGTAYRGNSEGKIRKWLVEKNYIERVVYIPNNKNFVDTNVSLILYVINKKKTTTDIIFEDLGLELSETVSIEKVAAENYCLSVSTYVEKPDTREPVDIDAVNKQAREECLKRLRANLELENLLIIFTNDREAYNQLCMDVIKMGTEYLAKPSPCIMLGSDPNG